jgi:hypothetical protein
MMALRAGGPTAVPAFLALAPFPDEAPSPAIGTSRTGKSGFTPRGVFQSASTGEKFEGIEL